MTHQYDSSNGVDREIVTMTHQYDSSNGVDGERLVTYWWRDCYLHP